MLIIEEAKNNPKHFNSYIKKSKNLCILLIHYRKSNGTHSTKDTKDVLHVQPWENTLSQYIAIIKDTNSIPLFSTHINQHLPEINVTEIWF